MIVLGIESSCDETAAAVLSGESGVLSNIVYSQESTHARFGGIVPEVASREHLAVISTVVRRALAEADVERSSLDAVAATRGPGLVGSLLVGWSFARAFALGRGLPLIGVNHLEGHLFAPFVTIETPPPFPFVALIVSGGHTSLYLARDFGDYVLLGRTRDDAAGEAFDKVAKMMGLGYPGGRAIDALAAEGDPRAVAFPRGMKGRGRLDFSFSGLKTAVKLYLERSGGSVVPADVAASFQEAVVDVLVSKAFDAVEARSVGALVVTGGVAANSGLRRRMEEEARARGIRLYCPPPALCTDNAAMIGWVGLRRLEAGRLPGLSGGVEARLLL